MSTHVSHAVLPNLKEASEVGTDMDRAIKILFTAGYSYRDAVKQFRRKWIIEALLENKGNQCKAARSLGMHRNTFSRTCSSLGIKPAEYLARFNRKQH